MFVEIAFVAKYPDSLTTKKKTKLKFDIESCFISGVYFRRGVYSRDKEKKGVYSNKVCNIYIY